MSFQEKNIVVTLANFTLILLFYAISLFQMIQGDGLQAVGVFRLWGIVVVLATVGTVLITIITHMVARKIRITTTTTNQGFQDFHDERDKLIELKGTNIAYRLTSIGVALAMLTFVFGQPPLVMFTLLIFFGILAQIIADITRLYLYRRGF
jgi:hypothetical protein